MSDTLTREVTALRARVEYLNARVDTEIAFEDSCDRSSCTTSVSSEGLPGVSISGFGERPEFLVRTFHLHHPCHDHQEYQLGLGLV